MSFIFFLCFSSVYFPHRQVTVLGTLFPSLNSTWLAGQRFPHLASPRHLFQTHPPYQAIISCLLLLLSFLHLEPSQASLSPKFFRILLQNSSRSLSLTPPMPSNFPLLSFTYILTSCYSLATCAITTHNHELSETEGFQNPRCSY